MVRTNIRTGKYLNIFKYPNIRHTLVWKQNVFPSLVWLRRRLQLIRRQEMGWDGAISNYLLAYSIVHKRCFVIIFLLSSTGWGSRIEFKHGRGGGEALSERAGRNWWPWLFWKPARDSAEMVTIYIRILYFIIILYYGRDYSESQRETRTRPRWWQLWT